ncbi:aspartate aminotransferase family protein [Nocardioides sp.]|uniref:pyridoxal phosphate-dependent decarboxylase family protein n=1 Tax=Nocardioides sp. TaxID=35761 RepID=UPI003514EBEB
MPDPATPAVGQLFHPAHADHYAATLRLGVDHLTTQLREVCSPARGTDPAEARARVEAIDLSTPLPDLAAVLGELEEVWLDGAVWFHEPAYAAHLNCPVAVPALLAELYIAAVNSSLDTFDQSVGATFIERRLIRWTAEHIGFPVGLVGDGGAATPEADGVFTSGGTQSNLQALLLARSRHDHLPAERLRFLASEEAHFSVQKAAMVLGLGAEAVISVPTDARRRMDPAALSRSLRACADLGLVPAAVVATVGTTDFGAIDPIPAIADLAAAHGAWLHVDAAYGGGLLVSPTRRHLLAGIERADSVTVDFHKTFFQPVSASALVVRDARTLAAVAWHADYLNPRPDGAAGPAAQAATNQVDRSLQTTRRFDALKLWLTLRTIGAQALGELVDHVVDLADDAHRACRSMDDLVVAAAPELSTLVLRYCPPDAGRWSGADLDRLQDAIRAELYRRGEAMVAATRVDGRRHLKLTLLNPMASLDDVVGVLEAVRRTGARLASAPDGAARTSSDDGATDRVEDAGPVARSLASLEVVR